MRIDPEIDPEIDPVFGDRFRASFKNRGAVRDYGTCVCPGRSGLADPKMRARRARMRGEAEMERFMRDSQHCGGRLGLEKM